MTTFQAVPVKEQVRTHTGLRKSTKRKIEQIARAQKVSQTTVLNSLLVKALKTK